MWNSVYTKIAAMGFCVGAGMEFFMIQTGFYDKVVEIEAERIQEHKEEREQWLSELKNRVQPGK